MGAQIKCALQVRSTGYRLLLYKKYKMRGRNVVWDRSSLKKESVFVRKIIFLSSAVGADQEIELSG